MVKKSYLKLHILILFLLSKYSVSSQVDEYRSAKEVTVNQQDSRIFAKMAYIKYSWMDQQIYKITISNLTGNNLKIKLKYFANLTCGNQSSQTVDIELKPFETLNEGNISYLFDYTGLISFADKAECLGNKVQVGDKTYINRIMSLGFELLELIDIDATKKKEEEERKREEEERKRKEEEERKREEKEEKKREEEERKREEKEEKKREEEKKQSDKEKNSKSKSKRKDSNSSSYVGGYIEDPAKERFNKDKQNAIDEKINRDIKNQNDIALATQLSVTSIGFYLYNPPKQRYYNTRGRFFSLGPQNSFLNIPIVSIKKSFREDLINYNYPFLPMYSKKEINIEPLADYFTVPTIGAGMSFGYIGDNVNFSLPINGSFGFFAMSQMSLNYGYGFNLFVGSPNFKIGIGTDFNYYSLTKNDFNATDYQHAYTTSSISFDSEASLLIKKLGIRFQKNMNSNSTNLELPKIVDFYLLFSNTNINNSSNLFDCSLETKDYGFEIVYNIYGKIGFTFTYLSMNPIDKINEPFDLFNKSSYFQIGVKKDYTWFKSY